MEHTIYDSDDDTEGFFLSDEQTNLDIELDSGYGSMIVIADLDLWDGHKSGYRIMGGKTVNMAFSAFSGDRTRLYYDSETDDLKGEDAHHDGTNKYTFREIRKGMMDRIDELTDLIYNGKATDEDIAKYTKPLGKYVRKVYGWKKDRKEKRAA